MIPPVFTILSADTTVTALLGTTPLRVFPDQAPQNTIKPYAVYTMFSGTPQNTFDEAAEVDILSTQIDIWADTSGSCQAVAEVVRTSLEPYAYLTSFASSAPDDQTPEYRVRLDFDFFKDR